MTMTRKTVSWGLLACGNIANKFAKAVNETDGSVLHAVSARAADSAQAFAEEHGATHFYGSYQAMLDDPEVDAVYISTIHPLHFEWITRCLLAGKHVLCEKPITMNLRQAKKVQKLAKEKGRLLREAFMYRHHPQTQKVADLVSSGVIGKVRMIEADFCYHSGVNPEHRIQAKPLGGGGILDLGCYPMSFARLIAGRAVDRLFAEPLELKAVGHLDNETKTDMWTTAVLRFEGDVLARLTCALRVNTDVKAVVYGEKGRITVERPWACDKEIRVQLDGSENVEVIKAATTPSLYTYEVAAFASELRGQAIGKDAVGMRLDDTLGNMKALDWWRYEIGLGYEADTAR